MKAMLVALAVFLGACEHRRPSPGTLDPAATLALACATLKPDELGVFTWTDGVVVYDGVTPAQFNDAPPWARGYIMNQVRRWMAFCG